MSSLQIRSKFSQLGEPCAPEALSWSSRSPCTIHHVPSAVILTLVEWLLCLEMSPMMLWTGVVLLTEATTQVASKTSRIYHRSHCHTPVCESAHLNFLLAWSSVLSLAFAVELARNIQKQTSKWNSCCLRLHRVCISLSPSVKSLLNHFVLIADLSPLRENLNPWRAKWRPNNFHLPPDPPILSTATLI